MSELARTFREARKAQSLSLDEAETSTKIRRRYLEAIEAGDFEQLPDGPPARGFVKNYARFLSLDGDQAIADFEAEVGVPVIRAHEYVPPPPSPSRKRSPSKYTRLEPPKLAWKGRLPQPDEDDLDGLAEDAAGRRRVFRTMDDTDAVDGEGDDDILVQRRTGKRPLIISRNSELRAGKSSFRLLNKNGSEALSSIPEISQVLPPKERKPYREPRPLITMPNLASVPKQIWQGLAGLVALAGLAILVTQVVVPRLNLSPRPTPKVSTPQTTPGVPVVSNPSGNTDVAKPQVTIFAPGGKPAQGGSAPAATAPQAIAPSPNGLQFSLDAREQAWVQVKVDGNVVYEGIPPLGPGAAWTAKQTVSIVTGNAGAFEVIVNGARMGRLGERNTVARKLYNTSGQVSDFQ